MLLTVLNGARQAVAQKRRPGYSKDTLTAADIGRDLNLAYRQLRRYHPDLYRFSDKKTLDSGLSSLINSAPVRADYWAAYGHLSLLPGMIRCGHTTINPADEQWHRLSERSVFFPFPTRWLADTLYIDLGAPGKEVWWRAVSINGKQTGDLLRNLGARLAMDGEMEEGKQGFLDNLSYYYAIWIERPPDFALELVSLTGDRDTAFRVNATSWNAVEELHRQKGIRFGSGALYPFRFERSGADAFLTVKNFNSARHVTFGADFPRFLDSVFSSIETASPARLMIDLRGNGGGDDAYGALLFSYLTSKPFRYFTEVKELRKGKLRSVPHPQTEIQQPRRNAYLGRVSLLTDGLTFSTASDFCAIFREHSRGNIYGTETGGAAAGNNSGISAIIHLPASAAALNIPMWRYTNAVTDPQFRRGVRPDFRIPPKLTWLFPAYDEVKSFAIRNEAGQP